MGLVVVVVAHHAEPHPLNRSVAGRDAQRDGVVGGLLIAPQKQAIVALLDANPGAGHVDVAQSGHVAFLHAAHIELDGGNALRTDDTLGQRVASPHQLFGGHRLQAQTSLFQAPLGVVGVVVPLPDGFEGGGRIVEVV